MKDNTPSNRKSKPGVKSGLLQSVWNKEELEKLTPLIELAYSTPPDLTSALKLQEEPLDLLAGALGNPTFSIKEEIANFLLLRSLNEDFSPDLYPYLKSFTLEGDLNHLINAVKAQGVKSLHCPILKIILHTLRVKFQSYLYNGDKKGMKQLRKLSAKIGEALLIEEPLGDPILKPLTSLQKRHVLLRSLDLHLLELFLKGKKRNVLTSESFIKERYAAELRKARREKKVTQSLIKKEKARLKGASPPERKKLSSKIRRWQQEVEVFSSERAKEKTIEHLVQLTGIRIGKRELASILYSPTRKNR